MTRMSLWLKSSSAALTLVVLGAQADAAPSNHPAASSETSLPSLNLTLKPHAADGALVKRLVEGSRAHAVRRAHEMHEVVALLHEYGLPAPVSQAAAETLERMIPTEVKA